MKNPAHSAGVVSCAQNSNKPKRTTVKAENMNTNHSLNIQAPLLQLQQVLSFIEPIERETWVRVGMAIKAAYSEAGFELWDNWSAQADSYRARDALAAWKSFKSAGGVGIGTVYYLAQQNGYSGRIGEVYTPTAAELAQRQARQQAEHVAQAQRRAAAACKARELWLATTDSAKVDQHPYLIRKGVKSHGLKRYHGALAIGGLACDGALMLPMYLDGQLCSLQFIPAAGDKRFLPNGEKGGFLIGTMAPDKPVCIAEGFATGASIHETTGYPVVVAFDAGNLKKMALAVRCRNPDVDLIICADQDESGTGQRKATEAAQAVNGRVAFPELAGVCHG